MQYTPKVLFLTRQLHIVELLKTHKIVDYWVSFPGSQIDALVFTVYQIPMHWVGSQPDLPTKSVKLNVLQIAPWNLKQNI